MAKARLIEFDEDVRPLGLGELCLVALPVETFRALTNEAEARRLTLAQLLKLAIDSVLAVPRGPTLLTEQVSNG